jgi:imidazolonepropionase-like amidohydrolase
VTIRRLLGAVVLVAAVAAAGETRAPATVLRAGRVLTGRGVLENGVVVVAEGKIAAVGLGLPVPAGAAVLDFPDATIMPGVIDAGSTMGLSARDENEASDEVTPEFRVRDGWNPRHPHFRRALAAGVTSVFVAPGTDNVWCGLGAVVKAAGETEADRIVRDPAALKIALGSDPSRGNQAPRGSPPLTFFFRRPTTRMGVTWMLRKGFFDARRYAEGFVGDGEGAPPGGHDPKLDVILDALRGRLPLFAHAREEHDIRAALRIADEFGVQVTVEEGCEAWKMADELARRKVAVTVGPAFFYPRRPRGGGGEGGGGGFGGGGSEQDGAIPALAARLHDAGVRIAFRSGSGAAATDLLAWAGQAVHWGLPYEAAIEALTIGAAEILGVADRIGSLEAGKDADLVVFRGDPLAPTSPVIGVMVGGRTELPAPR